MTSPFDRVVDGRLHAIQYNPHRNCDEFARFLGHPDLCHEEPCEAESRWYLDDGEPVDPGEWVVTLDFVKFDVCHPDWLLPLLAKHPHAAHLSG